MASDTAHRPDTMMKERPAGVAPDEASDDPTSAICPLGQVGGVDHRFSLKELLPILKRRLAQLGGES